jgi:hypothetical protein
MIQEYYQNIANSFDTDCTTKIAEQLIVYASEYLEGGINSSMDKYNKLFKDCKIKDWMYLLFHSPFERHSINLYNQILEVLPIEAFPKPVIEKINKDAEFLDNLSKYSMSV